MSRRAGWKLLTSRSYVGTAALIAVCVFIPTISALAQSNNANTTRKPNSSNTDRQRMARQLERQRQSNANNNQQNANARPTRPTPQAAMKRQAAARNRPLKPTIYTPEWAAANRAADTSGTLAATSSTVAKSKPSFGPEGDMMPGAMGMDEMSGQAEGRGQNRDGGKAFQAMQNIMKSASAEDKLLVQNYVRGLDRDRRRALSERLRYGSDAEKRENLIEMAKSGKAPESADEMRKRMGLPESPAAPEITIHGRNAAMVNVGKGAASSVAKASPLPSGGSPLPALTAAASASGAAVGAMLKNGKPTVLQVGSLTCPVYRASVEDMNRLARENTSANFAVVYTQEAHPKGSASPYAAGEWIPLKNEKDQVLVPQTKTEAERAANVETLRGRFGESRAVALDTMDNATWKALGARSHSVIVVDAAGRVVESLDSPSPEKIQAALQRAGAAPSAMTAGMRP